MPAVHTKSNCQKHRTGKSTVMQLRFLVTCNVSDNLGSALRCGVLAIFITTALHYTEDQHLNKIYYKEIWFTKREF